MSSSKKHRLLIAGGGTGGHVLAGIAIAESWRESHENSEILFVGSKGGLEEKLVKDYPLKLLSLGTLNRVSVGRKIKTAFQLPLSFLHSIYIFFSFRPKAVVGVGGYASGPMVMVASFFAFFVGCRTAILEQNAVPGMTNRWLGKLVDKIFLAFPSKNTGFLSSKTRITGNPIRSQMTPLPPAHESPFTLFVFGGSQGALGVNTLVVESLPFIEEKLEDTPFQVIHQTGPKDYARVESLYKALDLKKIKLELKEFVYEMKETYEQASLLICRSGASTLAEVAAVKRAALFIPLPTAADNHQEKNAQIFAQASAAMVRSQNKCSGEELAQSILELIKNPARLHEMEDKVSQFYRPNAAQDIVDELSYREPKGKK